MPTTWATKRIFGLLVQASFGIAPRWAVAPRERKGVQGQSGHQIYLLGLVDIALAPRAHNPIEEEIETRDGVQGQRHHPPDVNAIW